MYSTDPRLQRCEGAGAESKDRCIECLFTEVCLADTLDYEAITGESRAGIFGGLTTGERIARREAP